MNIIFFEEKKSIVLRDIENEFFFGRNKHTNMREENGF